MTSDGLKQTVLASSLAKERAKAKPDSSSQIAQLPQATRDRIAHIDFTLLFKGEAVRVDLVDRFSITAAQATKDFTMYRELAPGNIEYDQKLKLHKHGEAFDPLFDYDVVRTLWDGLMTWKIKKTTFDFSSPIIHRYSMIILGSGVILLFTGLFAPLTIPPVVLLSLIIGLALMAGLALSHLQKKI
jgi:hypothetical protein